VNPTANDFELGFMTENTVANWMAADNFTLTYYGEVGDDDPNKIILDGIIANYEKEFPDMDAVMANAEIKEAFEERMLAAKVVYENYEEEAAILTQAYNDLKASIADYAKLEKLLKEIQAKQEDFDAAGHGDLSNMLEDIRIEWEEFYLDGVATPEYIATANDTVIITIIEYINETVQPGDELTDLLIFNPNMDYSKGISGWTTNNVASGDLNNGTGQGRNILQLDLGDLGNDGTYYSNVLKEMNKNFEISQTFENMPAGCYTFTLNAFERNGNIDNALNLYLKDGDNAGCVAYIYLNDEQTVFKNIWAGSQDHVVWATDKGGEEGVVTKEDVTREALPGRYIPDTTTSANFFFNLCGAYLNSVSVYLPEKGTLKVGIKKGTTQDSFMVMDNMRLYYNGNDVNAFSGPVGDMIAKLETVLPTADSIYYGKDAADKVTATITELMESLTGTDVEACVTALANGKETLAYAKASLSAYKDIEDNMGLLSVNFEQYSETASPSVVKEAGTLFTVSEQVLDARNLNNEAAEALATRLNSVALLLTLPNFDDASVENQIDMSGMIINPTFDTIGDFTGWSGSSFGAGGTTSTCAERYDMNFDTYQDISGLPAGYYIVKVQGYYRRGSADNENAIHAANPDSALYTFLYATTPSDSVKHNICGINSGAVAESLGGSTSTVAGGIIPNSMEAAVYWIDAGYYAGNEVVIKVNEGETLRIGVKKEVHLSTDWSLFDNFQLFYTGSECPSTGIEEIIATGGKAFGKQGIYNLAGQKLTAPQRGLNIIGGKKVFVK